MAAALSAALTQSGLSSRGYEYESVPAAMLNSRVGGCEYGTDLLQNGNACFAGVSDCDDDEETVSLSFGGSLGFQVSITIEVPTACKQNMFSKHRCRGTIQYRADGSGDVVSVEDTECSMLKKKKKKKKCESTPSGNRCWDFGLGETASQFDDYVVESLDGVPPADVSYNEQTGELCITSDLLFGCKDGEESDYSCGPLYGAEVESCD